MEQQGERAERLGLTETICHRTNLNEYLALLWDWSGEDDFPLMSGAEITSVQNQPEICVIRRFPRCDYALIPMQGTMPNLQEPWPEILDWYPQDLNGLTTTIRRYDVLLGTGELLIPLAPSLTPEEIG